MDETGGIINAKHYFAKINAESNWSNLKVGSKLSFLLFEGSVRRIELIEASWDDNEVVMIQDEPEGYNTDCRTVLGTLNEIENEILIIETGSENVYVPLEDHPKLEWDFIPGDSVS